MDVTSAKQDCFTGRVARACENCAAGLAGKCCFGDPKELDLGDSECRNCLHFVDCKHEVGIVYDRPRRFSDWRSPRAPSTTGSGVFARRATREDHIPGNMFPVVRDVDIVGVADDETFVQRLTTNMLQGAAEGVLTEAHKTLIDMRGRWCLGKKRRQLPLQSGEKPSEDS